MRILNLITFITNLPSCCIEEKNIFPSIIVYTSSRALLEFSKFFKLKVKSVGRENLSVYVPGLSSL